MWHYATPPRGLPISELMQESNGRQSTLMFLLKRNKGNSIFWNEKQDAYEKGNYIPEEDDRYDDKGRLKGSIACFHYRVMAGTKINTEMVIDLLITISSYNRHFVENGDSDKIHKIEEYIDRVIMPGYVIRTKIELCYLYISHLRKQRSSNKEMSIHMKKVSPAESDDSPGIHITLDGKKASTKPDHPPVAPS